MADSLSKFDISQFRSEIKHDYHQTSHFNFLLNTPKGLLGGLTGADNNNFKDTPKSLLFEIESTNVPGIQIVTDEIVRYGYGSSFKQPYASIFNKIDMLVRSDSEGKIFDFFQSWLKLIVNFDMRNGINSTSGFRGTRPYEMTYSDDYAVDATITTYRKTGEEVNEIYLRQCYPFLMGDIVYDWSENNKLVKLPISLVFSDWYQKKTIASAPDVQYIPTSPLDNLQKVNIT